MTETARVHPTICISRYPGVLRTAKAQGYAFVGYDGIDTATRFVVLRHDLDLDLGCALAMAEIEAREGVRATYFVMLHNALYNPLSAASRTLLREIQRLGHTIGLHFDPGFHRDQAIGEALVALIHDEVRILASLVAHPVRWVSFHQPEPWFLERDFADDVFESVYNARFTTGGIRYIADSMGRWREESIEELLQSGRTDRIQFLAHPALWFHGNEPTLQARLERLVAEKARALGQQLATAVNDPGRGLVLFTPPE